MKRRAYKVYDTYKRLLIIGLIGIPIGAVVGLIDTVFGRILLRITDFRNQYPLYLIPFLALAGIVIVFCNMKFGGKSSGGMNLIFAVGHGEEEEIPFRLIPFLISGTWLTHLFGGSAGREGVAVQIGAAVSHWMGSRLPIKAKSNIFLVTGMAAGFAGLFQTPVAAVFFSMEVLVAGNLEYQALLPAVMAAFTASTVSKLLGLEKFTFALTADLDLHADMILKLVAMGMIFGMLGGAFSWVLKWTKTFLSEKMKNPLLRVAVTGVILSILLLLAHKGRYSGLGTNLIGNSFQGEQIFPYDWLLKFLFTVITLSAGFQGGEVTPLFAIGSSLGVILAGVFHLPVEVAAALGYVGMFGSATNTFCAPVFIGGEVFGYAYIPYFFLVCAVGYVFNMDKSIYTLQKKQYR